MYLRTTREKTPVIYPNGEEFAVGGCKVLRRSNADEATVVAAGITVHEALAAYEELKLEGVRIRVIDLYSVKPLDAAALRTAARETGLVIPVEDHYAAGGLGEAVAAALAPQGARVQILAVEKIPMSGKTAELLDYAGISRKAIAARVREARMPAASGA